MYRASASLGYTSPFHRHGWTLLIVVFNVVVKYLQGIRLCSLANVLSYQMYMFLLVSLFYYLSLKLYTPRDPRWCMIFAEFFILWRLAHSSKAGHFGRDLRILGYLGNPKVRESDTSSCCWGLGTVGRSDPELAGGSSVYGA